MNNNSKSTKCDICRYYTYSSVCHPNCGGCDGKSNFQPKTLKVFNTIAVDFDGTLCENGFPEIGEPKPLVIEYIKRQAAAGAHIILYTCRENGTKRNLLDEALQFCAEQGIELYAINENPDNTFPEEYGTSFGGRMELVCELPVKWAIQRLLHISSQVRTVQALKPQILFAKGKRAALCGQAHGSGTTAYRRK